mgnify:FL=1
MSLRVELQPYGPWAVVVGASEGIGEAFATQLAGAGLNVALVARREGPLSDLARKLIERFDVECTILSLDFSEIDAADRLDESTKDLDVGLAIYNAAFSRIGPFLQYPAEDRVREIMVNCVGPAKVARLFAARFANRAQSGLILMSSIAGFQGSPMVANYAATKAYNRVLAEGLWDELQGSNIDVLACNAGATLTPAYISSQPNKQRFSPPEMSPESVAVEALNALGRGPSVVTGRANRLATFMMNRLLTRRRAIRILGDSARSMYGTGTE